MEVVYKSLWAMTGIHHGICAMMQHVHERLSWRIASSFLLSEGECGSRFLRSRTFGITALHDDN